MILTTVAIELLPVVIAVVVVVKITELVVLGVVAQAFVAKNSVSYNTHVIVLL